VIDEEIELKKRFLELRDEEARWAPRFQRPQARRAARPRLLATCAAALILCVAALVLVGVRSRRTTFSISDRAAIQAIDAWRSPTQFLLVTPGAAILSTTPAIPDLSSAVPRMKGAKR
jgi:hypothetical protein